MSETAKRRNGETAKKPIQHFRDLEVYQNALAAGLRIYDLSKQFPSEERYVLTDQIRRSSRSFVQTAPRHAESGGMTQLLLPNLATQKVKLQKRRFIWNLRFAIATSLTLSLRASTMPMKKLSASWLR
jgi:23S rRNA-intervening sequence protein